MSRLTIYMPLLGEGVDVMRPVTAERIAGENYLVLGPMPEDEEWAFAPGSIVSGRHEQRDGRTLIVVVASLRGGRLFTIAPEARRDILVAVWEEDAVLDVLRALKAEYGETDDVWLAAIEHEAKLGTLEAYRYPTDRPGFDPVEATTLATAIIGTDHRDAVYLSRTDTTVSAILTLPPPPIGDSSWMIGLWGHPPE